MSIQVENPGNWLKLGILPSAIGSVTLEFLIFPCGLARRVVMSAIPLSLSPGEIPGIGRTVSS